MADTPQTPATPHFKPAPTPDFALADALIEELKITHWDPDPKNLGMHAYGYTQSEQEAIDIVVRNAVDLGMEAFSDLAGNMYLIKRGKSHEKTDVIVSHLDTVEKGGAHDGRDGIAAGMAAISGLNKAGILPEHDVCVMIARSEESCVNGLVSIGAKAATGGLKMAELAKLENRTSGKSVLAHMKSIGIPTGRLSSRLDASPTLFPTGDTAKNLIGFLVEAHIEQGNYCAEQNIEVGIVDKICGNTRFLDCEFHGEAAHTGATRDEDRADTNVAYIELMHAALEWKRKKIAEGKKLVFSPTIVKCANDSATTIANHTKFCFEIRSADEALLHEFAEFIKTTTDALMREHPNDKLKLTIPPVKISKPAVMNEQLIAHTKQLAEAQNIKAGVITSGAGHDTVQFANTGTPSIMLFIRQPQAISHNPAESRDTASFQDACRIISGMLVNPPDISASKTSPAGNEPKSFTDYLIQQGARAYKAGQWRT